MGSAPKSEIRIPEIRIKSEVRMKKSETRDKVSRREVNARQLLERLYRNIVEDDFLAPDGGHVHRFGGTGGAGAQNEVDVI